jgi:hypothetical protein
MSTSIAGWKENVNTGVPTQIILWHDAGIVKSEQTFIARQRLGKHILAATNMQTIIEKPPLLCNGTVNTPSQQLTDCLLRGPCKSGYKEKFSWEEWVEFRDASRPGYELGSTGIELRPIFGIGSCRIMARKELRCEKKTSYVIWSDSDTVINPLTGYD